MRTASHVHPLLSSSSGSLRSICVSTVDPLSISVPDLLQGLSIWNKARKHIPGLATISRNSKFVVCRHGRHVGETQRLPLPPPLFLVFLPCHHYPCCTTFASSSPLPDPLVQYICYPSLLAPLFLCVLFRRPPSNKPKQA
jgi:hypothetical protein